MMDAAEFILLYLNASDEIKDQIAEVLKELQPHPEPVE